MLREWFIIGNSRLSANYNNDKCCHYFQLLLLFNVQNYIICKQSKMYQQHEMSKMIEKTSHRTLDETRSWITTISTVIMISDNTTTKLEFFCAEYKHVLIQTGYESHFVQSGNCHQHVLYSIHYNSRFHW